jgi:Bacterial protein of unknown function (DUF937)
MTSLLGSLGQVLTPDVVGALGRAVGQDNALVQKGLDVVGPLVLSSLAKKSETTSGLDGIMRMLPQDGGAGDLGNVLGALGQQDPMKTLVKDARPTSLVDVAFGSLGKLDADSTLDKQSPRDSLVTTLQAATAAVKAKSPADAKSFGDTLVALSRKVAEASREGGFLGIGGTRVSKDEEQAIAEIAAAVA